MPQQEKISAQDAADYLESDEFKKLSPDKKKKVVDYFKANLSREAPDVVPNTIRKPGPGVPPHSAIRIGEGGVVDTVVGRAKGNIKGILGSFGSSAQDDYEKIKTSTLGKIATRNPITRGVRSY